MFETLKMIIAILREKEAVPEETISVTLAELSTVWIRYNNSFMDAIPKGPRELPPAPRIIEVAPVVEPAPDRTVRPEPKTDPASVEVATSAFYSDVIEPYRDLLERDKALTGIKAMVGILRSMGGVPPSCGRTTTRKGTMPRGSRRSSHGVSLRDHTFRTARIAMQNPPRPVRRETRRLCDGDAHRRTRPRSGEDPRLSGRRRVCEGRPSGDERGHSDGSLPGPQKLPYPGRRPPGDTGAPPCGKGSGCRDAQGGGREGAG